MLIQPISSRIQKMHRLFTALATSLVLIGMTLSSAQASTPKSSEAARTSAANVKAKKGTKKTVAGRGRRKGGKK